MRWRTVKSARRLTCGAFVDLRRPCGVQHREDLDYGAVLQNAQEVAGVRAPRQVGRLVEAREELRS